MKTITIEDSTWQKVSNLRTRMLNRNFSEVLEYLLNLDMINERKLKKEKQE